MGGRGVRGGIEWCSNSAEKEMRSEQEGNKEKVDREINNYKSLCEGEEKVKIN